MNKDLVWIISLLVIAALGIGFLLINLEDLQAPAKKPTDEETPR